MTPSSEVSRQVEERAGSRCEYCRMHQALQGATFHVEHVLPRSLGGQSNLDNFAWACPSCNLHKSNRVEATAPGMSDSSPFFNPRSDQWEDHFRWDEFRIAGITQVGEATVEALHFNHDRRLKIRQAEALFGLFPPT